MIIGTRSFVSNSLAGRQGFLYTKIPFLRVLYLSIKKDLWESFQQAFSTSRNNKAKLFLPVNNFPTLNHFHLEQKKPRLSKKGRGGQSKIEIFLQIKRCCQKDHSSCYNTGCTNKTCRDVIYATLHFKEQIMDASIFGQFFHMCKN